MAVRDTLLVIDTAERDYQSLSSRAEQLGIRFCFLSDPDEALARSTFDDVLACLINIELRGMTGLELYERLRPRLENIPVFMVDDQCDSANEIAVLATGRLHYLCKPVEAALLDALAPAAHGRESMDNRPGG